MKKIMILCILPVVCGLFSVPAKAVTVQWASNGHYYNFVNILYGGQTWESAKQIAENSTYMGFQGHLATVTSVEENLFISNSFAFPGVTDSAWLGGYQIPGSAPDEGWTWVTGEPWEYTNWIEGAPNDMGGMQDENVLSYMTVAGQTPSGLLWNDLNSARHNTYIIEYEPTSSPTPVPEPTSIILGLIGLSGALGLRKRKPLRNN